MSHAVLDKLALDLRWQGWSDVHIAARSGNADKLRGLISKGEPVDKPIPKILQTALHIAADNGFEFVVSELLDRLAKSYVLDSDKRTPLHLAAVHGHLKCVQLLVGPRNRDYDRAKCLDAADKNGYTPLMLAVEQGHVNVANELLRVGSSVKCSTIKGGLQPIHLAAKSGSLYMLALLVKAGCHLEERAEGGNTLHYATHEGHTQAVQWLLQSHVNPKVRNWDGLTPMDVARFRNHDHLAEMMITFIRAYPTLWPDEEEEVLPLQEPEPLEQQQYPRQQLDTAQQQYASQPRQSRQQLEYVQQPGQQQQQQPKSFFDGGVVWDAMMHTKQQEQQQQREQQEQQQQQAEQRQWYSQPLPTSPEPVVAEQRPLQSQQLPAVAPLRERDGRMPEWEPFLPLTCARLP